MHDILLLTNECVSNIPLIGALLVPVDGACIHFISVKDLSLIYYFHQCFLSLQCNNTYFTLRLMVARDIVFIFDELASLFQV